MLRPYNLQKLRPLSTDEKGYDSDCGANDSERRGYPEREHPLDQIALEFGEALFQLRVHCYETSVDCYETSVDRCELRSPLRIEFGEALFEPGVKAREVQLI